MNECRLFYVVFLVVRCSGVSLFFTGRYDWPIRSRSFVFLVVILVFCFLLACVIIVLCVCCYFGDDFVISQ